MQPLSSDVLMSPTLGSWSASSTAGVSHNQQVDQPTQRSWFTPTCSLGEAGVRNHDHQSEQEAGVNARALLAPLRVLSHGSELFGHATGRNSGVLQVDIDD